MKLSILFFLLSLVTVFCLACCYWSYHSPCIHFVGFHSEDLRPARDLYEPQICSFVDTCRFYTDTELRQDPTTQQLVKEFEEECPANIGSYKNGFFRWKPYVILKTMENIPYGDIVYYRDCNIIKYPNILKNIEHTRDIVARFMKETDLFVPVESRDFTLQQYCKREVFEEFSVYEDPRYMNAPLLNASVIICRKTDVTIQILKEWLQACMKDDLIDCKTRVPQHSEFRWHTYDQAFLNIILQMYRQRGIIHVPYYVMPNRTLSSDLEPL